MTNLNKKILCALSCAILGFTSGMSASFAAPGGPGSSPRGPSAGPHKSAPAPHRSNPAPRYSGPAHHQSAPRYHHHDSDWVAPLMFGAIVAGVTASAINSSRQATDYSAAQQTAPYNQSVTTNRTNTLFWCESEKAFYPDVRACPTGWTAVPSSR
jgi:hypothetical protein